MSKVYKVRRYSYDQRRRGRHRIIRTIALVLVLAGLAAAGWFAYDPIYEFVTNRTNRSREESSQSEPAPQSTSQQQSGAEASEVFGEGTPEPGPAETLPEVTAYLPQYALTGGDLQARLAALKNQGVQGVLFDLKGSDGRVMYSSTLESVAANAAQTDTPYDLRQTVPAVREAGLIPVGRIYAFKDHVATAHMYDAAVKYMDSKINWLDNSRASGGRSWLNPANEEARAYVLEIAQEAAGAGLTQIVLDGVQFPEGYALDLATYGVQGTLNKSDILADFLRKAREKEEDWGVAFWPTINLLSASGFSEVRYGSDVGLLIEASGRAVIEVMPEQFGNGVTGETLTLSSPVLEPYGTVRDALAACTEVLDVEGAEYAAVLQAYTSTTVTETMPYTSVEVAEQARAVREFGIQRVIWYNAGGNYA